MQPKFAADLKKIVRAGDDLAVLYDVWCLAASDSDGNSYDMNGKGVHIVRRQPDGTWIFAVTGITNASF